MCDKDCSLCDTSHHPFEIDFQPDKLKLKSGLKSDFEKQNE